MVPPTTNTKRHNMDMVSNNQKKARKENKYKINTEVKKRIEYRRNPMQHGRSNKKIPTGKEEL